MFCYLKLRRVMSVFASPVASSDRSVMILICLESVESQLANRYLVCADPISNKGLFTLSSVLSVLVFFRSGLI